MKIAEMSVEYVNHMGSDLSVVNAARVSFSKASEWEYEFDELLGTLSDNPHLAERDVKLINYLAKHNHWTPFGHAFVSMRIKAPIFVARQAVKHQVGLVWNEVSRRYVDDEPEYFLPSSWRSRPESSMKQGSGTGTVDTIMCQIDRGEDELRPVNDLVEKMVWDMGLLYKHLVDSGVAPEQARMVLPLNTMTEWIWSGSLAAFCRVCKLRLDPHAQLEIQELAEGIKRVVEPLFPVSFNALMEDWYES